MQLIIPDYMKTHDFVKLTLKYTNNFGKTQQLHLQKGKGITANMLISTYSVNKGSLEEVLNFAGRSVN